MKNIAGGIQVKFINLHERFARSLFAGVFASITLLSLNLFSYYVHLSKRRFINYAALIVFGRKFNNLAEAIFCSIAQIGFAAGLIVLSSYFVLKEKRQNRLLRGLFVGIGSWFSIMVFAYLKGIHKVLPIDIGSAISFVVTSAIWGITGAWVLYALDKRYSNEVEPELETKRNSYNRTKYFLTPAPANKIKQRKTVKPKKVN